MKLTQQNTSHAVMAQRVEAKDSLDDFPTPPWATRALIEHIIQGKAELKGQSALEPACGEGHMAKVLAEYFGSVTGSDVYPYGYGEVADFVTAPYEVGQFDWVITNPPFRLAEDFIQKGLSIATRGVAILARTVFIESVGRYERIFRDSPPTVFAQFTERVPMVKGRLDRRASTATGYAWLVWDKTSRRKASLGWIPPCRKQLELDSDYSKPQKSASTSGEQVALSKLRPKTRRKPSPSKAQVDLFGAANNDGTSRDTNTRD